jgi:hypothetical protein
MTTAAIVIAAALAVLAVLWVARPLVTGGESGDEAGLDEAALERLRLLEARDRALAALKELEFDHRTGKVTDADYGQLVRPLRAEAAEALAALDAFAEAAPTATAGRAPRAAPAGAGSVPAAAEREEGPG